MLPPNTYETPSRQELKRLPPTAASGRDSVLLVSASDSIFASSSVQVVDAAPNTYRGSRSLAPGEMSGETARSPRPRSSSVPSCRPPHDVDLVRAADPLSPGSGKGQSREMPSASCARPGERGSEDGRPIKPAGCRTFGLRIDASSCSRHPGTSRSLRARSWWLPLDGGLTRRSLLSGSWS